MRRPISKSLGFVFVAAMLTASVAYAAEPAAKTKAPPVPEVAGTTAAAAPAPDAAKPAAAAEAPKKHHALKARVAGPMDAVTVELPKNDDVYPDKPGAVAVDRNCLVCHSPEVVANQPQLTRAQWAAEIKKMRDAFNAPIADDDEQTILDYLVSLRGEARKSWR